MTTTDMTDLLDTLYGSLASGDASAWEDNMADDALCIGTDAIEWWHGRDAMMPVLRAQIAEMGAAGISMKTGDAVIAEHGDVVWAADRPTMTQPDGVRHLVASHGGRRARRRPARHPADASLGPGGQRGGRADGAHPLSPAEGRAS